MANVTKFISAGLDRIEYMAVDSAGYLASATGATLANGSNSAMGRLIGAKAVPYTVPEAERVPATGDDAVLGTFQFASGDPSAFVLELGANDMDFTALAQGTLVEAVSNWSWGLVRPGTLTFTDICLNLVSQAKSQASGSLGAALYKSMVLPKCNLTALGMSGIARRNAQTVRFGVTVNPTDRTPWGALMAEGTQGDTKADAWEVTTDNRLSFHTFRGNGAATTVTLNNTPAAAAATAVKVFYDGVIQAYTTNYTVNTGTRVVTFVTAPGAGVRVTIVYEYV